MEEVIDDDDSFFQDMDDILPLNQSIPSNALLEDIFSSSLGSTGITTHCQTPLAQSTPHSNKQRLQPTTRTRPVNAQSLARLQCPQCPKTYPNKHTLGVHVKMHALKSKSLLPVGLLLEQVSCKEC